MESVGAWFDIVDNVSRPGSELMRFATRATTTKPEGLRKLGATHRSSSVVTTVFHVYPNFFRSIVPGLMEFFARLLLSSDSGYWKIRQKDPYWGVRLVNEDGRL